MKKAFCLDWGHYPNGILVTMNLSKEEIIKFLTYWDALPHEKHMDEFQDQLEDTVRARTHDLANGWYLIEFPRKEKITDNLIGTLVHELFHACEFKFGNVNIPHTDDTSEVWAYMMSYLTQRSLENMRSKETNWSEWEKDIENK